MRLVYTLLLALALLILPAERGTAAEPTPTRETGGLDPRHLPTPTPEPYPMPGSTDELQPQYLPLISAPARPALIVQPVTITIPLSTTALLGYTVTGHRAETTTILEVISGAPGLAYWNVPQCAWNALWLSCQVPAGDLPSAQRVRVTGLARGTWTLYAFLYASGQIALARHTVIVE